MAKKVLAFGTFDILHPGHLKYLRDAKRLGDSLTVVVARDRNAFMVKKRKPDMHEDERLKNILSLPMVDDAILGHIKDAYKVIEEEKPDIIALGYDQAGFAERLEEELGKRKVASKIVRLKPYKRKIYKSSLLRQ